MTKRILLASFLILVVDFGGHVAAKLLSCPAL